MYRNSWPLLALATYRDILHGTGAKSHGRINGAFKDLKSEIKQPSR